MQALLIAFTALVGGLSAFQAGTNASLGKTIGPVQSGLTSMLLGTFSIVVLGLCLGGLAWPGAEKVAAAPWWAWLGGIMGAVLITAQLYVDQQLGSALFAAIFVTATLVTSVTLDHFGLVGFKQHSATWLRLGGITLMVIGVALVSKG